MHWIGARLRRVCVAVLIIGLGAGLAIGLYVRSLSAPVPLSGQVDVDDALLSALHANIQPGDLIFRGRANSWGDLGARLSDRDQRFGHVGVIVQGSGAAPSFEVIDAAGHPLSRDATVARGRLDHFLHRADQVGVYRVVVSDERRKVFLAALERHADIATPFDNHFSLASSDALYCTELIRAALMEATGVDPIEEVTLWQGERVIALDDLQGSPIVFEVMAWSSLPP